MPIATDEAVVRIRGELDPSVAASAQGMRSALQRLDQDVQQASADFNAGVITVEDYRVALARAREEAVALRSAGVQPVGRDLTAFNRILRATEPAASAGGRGLGTIRSALASMSAQAIGARGTVGSLAGAVLQFAAGNTIAVGVVAGVAAIALAYRALTRDAREAREEQEKFVAGALEARRRLGGPITVLETDLARARGIQAERRADLRTAQAGQLVSRGQGVRELVVDPEAVRQATTALGLVNAKVQVLEAELAEARKKAADDAAEAARKARDEELKALSELAKLDALRLADLARLLELQHQVTAQLRDQASFSAEDRARLLGQAGTIGAALQRAVLTPPSIRQIAGTAPGLRFTQPQFVGQEAGPPVAERFAEADAVLDKVIGAQSRYNETLSQLDQLLQQGTISEDQYNAAKAEAARAADRATGATDRLAKSQERFAIAAINTAAALIAQAVGGGGGGLGGFLGLAGGLLSFVNPIAGAVVGGLGAVVSAADRRDPVPVQMVDVSDRAADKLTRGRTGPDRITIIGVDRFGNAREVLEQANRLTQRDALDRLRGAEVPVVG